MPSRHAEEVVERLEAFDLHVEMVPTPSKGSAAAGRWVKRHEHEAALAAECERREKVEKALRQLLAVAEECIDCTAGMTALDETIDQARAALPQPEGEECETCGGDGDIYVEYGRDGSGRPTGMYPCPDCGPEGSER